MRKLKYKEISFPLTCNFYGLQALEVLIDSYILEDKMLASVVLGLTKAWP